METAIYRPHRSHGVPHTEQRAPVTQLTPLARLVYFRHLNARLQMPRREGSELKTALRLTWSLYSLPIIQPFTTGNLVISTTFQSPKFCGSILKNMREYEISKSCCLMGRKHKLSKYFAKEKCEICAEEKAWANHDSVLAIYFGLPEEENYSFQQMVATITDVNQVACWSEYR